MKRKLLWDALLKYIMGLAAVFLLLFIPAGTISFQKGWILVTVVFLPMVPVGALLYFKKPELLAKRLQAKEPEPEQKQAVLFSALMFLVGFVTTGLDFRFGWSRLPDGVTIGACIVLLLGYGIFGEVLRENNYLARTVEVQKEQKLIDTGLYGLVRHPMYTATLLIYWSMPLICGSGWALIPFLFYPLILRKRILNEEKVLEMGLPGYKEYTSRVRWKLIPGLW